MAKLSNRARLLLFLVGERTERDWSTGTLSRFFVPSADAYHYLHNGKSEFTYIMGARDANALKGLCRKGLIERPRTSLAGEYIYALTEDGLQTLQAITEFE